LAFSIEEASWHVEIARLRIKVANQWT